MSYQNIAIDGNNLYWRAVCNCFQKAITVKEEDRTMSLYSSVVQDFIDRVNSLKKDYLYNNGKVYLLFDNPKSTLTLRQIIDEEYKSPRMNRIIPEAFWDTLKILKQILLHYSNDFVFLQAKFCEADDLVIPLIENIEISKTKRLLLVSADLDWSRGISENIDWFNFKTVYNKNNFYEEYKFFPERKNVVLYKVFRGDASDNIEIGLPNISEKLLLTIIDKSEVNDFASFRLFLHSLQSVDFLSKDWKLKIKENEDRLLKNYQLIDFMPVNLSFEEIKIQCEEFVSVLRTYYKLLKLPFESKMMSKEENEDSFFEQASYKRMKRFYRV